MIGVKILTRRFISAGLLLITMIFCQPHVINAADTASLPETTNGRAPIVFLEGMASLVGKDNKKIRQINQGDIFKPGDRLRTAIKGRLILQFPDGSYLRCDELTTVEIVAISVDQVAGRRDIRCRVMAGNVWIFVSQTARTKGGIVISAPMVVSETDSSSFRITVHSDNSSLLKVYRGLIYMHNPRPSKSSSSSVTAKRFGSKKNWHHYVKPMYQLLVRADGSASRPFQFMTKADRDEWVVWNQALDKKLK